MCGKSKRISHNLLVVFLWYFHMYFSLILQTKTWKASGLGNSNQKQSCCFLGNFISQSWSRCTLISLSLSNFNSNFHFLRRWKGILFYSVFERKKEEKKFVILCTKPCNCSFACVIWLVALVKIFSTAFSNISSNRLPVKRYSHIGCICLTILHCAFSNVSSNHLSVKKHSHIGCICLIFLHCAFSNVFSNHLPV